MIYLKSLTIAAFIVLNCNFSQALARTAKDTCSASIFEAVKRDLKLEKLSIKEDASNVVSSACKAWPYKDDLLLAAFAYDEGVKYEKKRVVAVIDKKKMHIVSSHANDISEDAVTEVGNNSFKVDTAKYQLAEDIRAFGVVFNNSARGPSCGEAYWGKELTLYTINAGKLRPMLVIDLWRQQWLAGCPASVRNDMPSFWEDAALSLSMAQSSTNGLRDIVATAKIAVNSGEGMAKEFKNRKNRIEKRLMRFDGKTYKSTKEAWWLGNF